MALNTKLNQTKNNVKKTTKIIKDNSKQVVKNSIEYFKHDSVPMEHKK
ncbi:hypothetical protein [Leuconostoc mesenteroides]|nr:hypothetical protein [Leuconostoc mesenteroides]USI45349.1 hypothetical protein M0D19_07590 [Leuconostoc mesenteroides]